VNVVTEQGECLTFNVSGLISVLNGYFFLINFVLTGVYKLKSQERDV
jgi:hypothetical protein